MKILCEQKENIFLCEIKRTELHYFMNAPRSFSAYSGEFKGFIMNQEFEINRNNFKDDFDRTKKACEEALKSMRDFSEKYMSFMKLLTEQIKEEK